MNSKNNITRALLTGVVGLALIGGLVAGCQLFDKNSSSLTAPTAETVRPENFIIGSADSDQWDGQYAEDNTYFIVNIPVTGAVKVEYTITGGATYAIFVDATTPTKWEIGLKTVDGVTDTLQSVCVTYTEGVTFVNVPADATTSTQHQATHYLRKLENGTENWWPVDAAFAFAGETKTVCVVTDGVVQGEEVVGPFPKPFCEGVSMFGYCWHLTPNGTSCNTLCASYGGWNTATKTFWAGHTGADCNAVLNALSAPVGNPMQQGSGTYDACKYMVSANRRERLYGGTSTGNENHEVQACACLN